jgi:hypothetical protein
MHCYDHVVAYDNKFSWWFKWQILLQPSIKIATLLIALKKFNSFVSFYLRKAAQAGLFQISSAKSIANKQKQQL